MDKKFNKRFPIYPVLGNHEKFPCDQYTENETELLEGLANVYKDYLDDEAYESFKTYGYYSMKHLNTNIRMVALNCFLCDNMNYNFLSSHKKAQMQIKWMENTFREAEKNGEYIYILDHFPINSIFELTECALRKKALIDRFSYIIRGHFSGHTHTDDISVVTEYFNSSKPIAVNYVAPSLTTFSKHFPAFRIFYADTKTKNIIDYVQYFLNLTKANEEGKAIWEVNYKASEFFKAKNLQDLEAQFNVETEGDYIIHRYGNTPQAIKKAHKEVEIRRAKCNVQKDTYHSYLECAFPKISIQGIKDWFFELLNRFQGKWVDEGILDV
ncbi:MAG: metallophosphoesterase [archaeon]|nr:metallophosphoesterase [archaeon]